MKIASPVSLKSRGLFSGNNADPKSVGSAPSSKLGFVFPSMFERSCSQSSRVKFIVQCLDEMIRYLKLMFPMKKKRNTDPMEAT